MLREEKKNGSRKLKLSKTTRAQEVLRLELEKNSIPSYQSDWSSLILFSPQEEQPEHNYPQLKTKCELSFTNTNSEMSNQIVEEMADYLKIKL